MNMYRRLAWLLPAAYVLVGCAGWSPYPLGEAPQALSARPPAILLARSDSTGAFHIQTVDAATGSVLPSPTGFELETGGAITNHTISPDGRWLAIAAGSSDFCQPFGGGSACWDAADVLHFVDLKSGQVSSGQLAEAGRISSMAFNPSGEHLAITFHSRDGIQILTFLVPSASPDSYARLSLDPSVCGVNCTSLAYTRDGSGLLVFGVPPGEQPGIEPPGPAQVVLLDSGTLAPMWTHTLEGFQMGSWCVGGCDPGQEAVPSEAWYPAVTLQPGTDFLLALHAEAERLTSIDFGRRFVQSFDIHAAQTWLGRLMAFGTWPAQAKGASEGAVKRAVFSPDGSRLYTLSRSLHAAKNEDGVWEGWDEPLGLDVIDPATGLRLDHRDTDAGGLGLSKDGRWILLTGWDRFEGEILDAVSLKSLATFDGWELLPVRSLDGQAVLLAYLEGEATTRFAFIDPSTMKRSRAWVVDGHAFVITP